MSDYYDEFAAKQAARHAEEQARYLAYQAAQARLPPNSRDFIDPTAGDVRRSFYETLSLRGD